MTVGAGVFWSFMIAAVWVDLGDITPVIRTAAATFAVIAAMLWLVDGRAEGWDRRFMGVTDEYRRREAVLIKMAARLADEPTTGPLPRLYPVR